MLWGVKTPHSFGRKFRCNLMLKYLPQLWFDPSASSKDQPQKPEIVTFQPRCQATLRWRNMIFDPPVQDRSEKVLAIQKILQRSFHKNTPGIFLSFSKNCKKIWSFEKKNVFLNSAWSSWEAFPTLDYHLRGFHSAAAELSISHDGASMKPAFNEKSGCQQWHLKTMDCLEKYL